MKIYGMDIKSVLIGGYEWAIEECELSGEGNEGCCNTERFVIQIQKGMREETVFATLIHEMIHAVFHTTGGDFGEDEEKIIKHLDMLLSKAIYDNFLKKKTRKDK